MILSCVGSKSAAVHPAPAPAEDNVLRHYSSVAIITAELNGRPILSGTAFAIDRDHLLTAAHVCLAALEIQIFMTRQKSLVLTQHNNKGFSIALYGAEVEDISSTDDICILRRPNHGLLPVTISSDYGSVRSRDPVTIIGAPSGISVGEFYGKVMNPKLRNKLDGMLRDRLIITAPATGGVSGSPVFNKKGHVIGILVAGHMTFDHLSICVNGDAILKFLKESKYRR